MGMHLHRGDRTDALARALGELLREPPVDPFAPELVAVPTRGVERFLAQHLAGQLGVSSGSPTGADGICANVLFPQPHRLVDDVLARCTGIDPAADPWQARRLVWGVLDTLDEVVPRRDGGAVVGERCAWAAPLAAFLERGKGRRFQLADHVARLFTSYAAERPGMLEAWLAGEDLDALGRPLPPELAWHAPLFRAVRQRLGVPAPAERLALVGPALAADPGVVGLPTRLSVFGATRLPAAHLAVLAALAVQRDVHLWLADPSPRLWESLPRLAEPAAGLLPRAADSSGAQAAHPLLRSLGRDARELAVRLQAGAAGAVATDVEHPGEPPSADLLGWLRHDLLANQSPQPLGRRFTPQDTSVSLHSCHGQLRQAEVLREAILGLLAADESLEPRDIIVMCPDLATFAPLISAAFTGPTGSPLAELRVRIADRTPEQDNEILVALQALLDLLPGRIGAAALLDFADLPAVRRKLRLSEDDLVRARELVAQAGVRWGLDQEHRGEFQLQHVPLGTWSAGLARMQLGIALSEEGSPTFGEVLPLDEVASTDLEIVGSLGELIAAVQQARTWERMRAPIATWVSELSTSVQRLCAADPQASWQMPAALGALSRFAADATDPTQSGGGPQLSISDVRLLLAQLLAGRPTRTNFRSGGLTVCGLEPMRSVPHRVVALVGLDEGSYPRSALRDGDNVLLADPALGERDPRSEDRQILLDAIMAARQHLLITFCGRDEHTNEELPPCVPVAELLDALADSVENSADVRASVVCAHPLQPFDSRNFLPGAIAAGNSAFSHDPVSRAAAQAAAGPRSHPAPKFGGLLPYNPPPALSLTELASFLANPIRELLKRRLGLTDREQEEPLREDLPISLEGLDNWQVGDRLLTARLHGSELEQLERVEQLRGVVPPGLLGREKLQKASDEVAALAKRVETLRAERPLRRPNVNLTLANGRVVGTVADVDGVQIVRATFSRSPANRLFAMWIDLLALSAGASDNPGYRGCLMTRGASVTMLAPPPAESAHLLGDLVALHDLGMRQPLPLLTEPAKVYAKLRSPSRAYRRPHQFALNAAAGALQKWDLAQPAWKRVYGPALDFNLLAAARTPAGCGFDEVGEPLLFGALAVRVWDPILRWEQ